MLQSLLGPKPGQLEAHYLEHMAFLGKLQEKGSCDRLLSASVQEDTGHLPLRSLAQGREMKVLMAPLVSTRSTGTWCGPRPGGFGHGI